MRKKETDKLKKDEIIVGSLDNHEEHEAGLLPELLRGDFIKRGTTRRDFLKVMGFSIVSAAIIEGCKRPVQKAIPYVIQPPE